MGAELNIFYMRHIFDQLVKREEEDKGMQPELVLGCYLDSGVQDYSICGNCRCFNTTCRDYLKPFEKKVELFKRYVY